MMSRHEIRSLTKIVCHALCLYKVAPGVLGLLAMVRTMPVSQAILPDCPTESDMHPRHALMELPSAVSQAAAAAATQVGLDSGEEAGVFEWPEGSGQRIAYRGDAITSETDFCPRVWLAVPL